MVNEHVPVHELCWAITSLVLTDWPLTALVARGKLRGWRLKACGWLVAGGELSPGWISAVSCRGVACGSVLFPVSVTKALKQVQTTARIKMFRRAKQYESVIIGLLA